MNPTTDPSFALPDPQTAYDHLFRNVHAQLFFQKCAAAGFCPTNELEAHWMLDTAGKLRLLAESLPAKQAAAEESPYYHMNAGLDGLLSAVAGAEPAGAEKDAADAWAGYGDVAARLMDDPALYNSALALRAAEAAQLRTELDALTAAG